MLVTVGPAGSQEVQVSTAPLRAGGLGNISPSATRTSLTDGSRRGFFFRVVPNDDQQGPRVANYITRTVKAQRVTIVDAQNSYSTGLADTVERILKARGLQRVDRESVSEANVTDFSSLIARIPANTQVVYIPWQLAPKAQLFGQQLRAAGKSARLFGSDGLFDPDNFKIPNSLISFFPVDLKSKVITAYARSHGGSKDLFGLPAYVAAQVAAGAIDRACKNNRATRVEVRQQVAKTNISKAQSLLGFKTRFVRTDVSGPQGPGDLATPADFGIYRITNSGAYVRVS
jgi:branched-chain amino acid transport system substrate-binding protein